MACTSKKKKEKHENTNLHSTFFITGFVSLCIFYIYAADTQTYHKHIGFIQGI